MKYIQSIILITLMLTNVAGNWIIIFVFGANKTFIAQNICENRYRPEMKCNGHCVFMKKLREKDKEEQNSSSSDKTESPAIISSRSYFTTIESGLNGIACPYPAAGNEGKPNDRSIPVFQPPCA